MTLHYSVGVHDSSQKEYAPSWTRLSPSLYDTIYDVPTLKKMKGTHCALFDSRAPRRSVVILVNIGFIAAPRLSDLGPVCIRFLTT